MYIIVICYHHLLCYSNEDFDHDAGESYEESAEGNMELKFFNFILQTLPMCAL